MLKARQGEEVGMHIRIDNGFGVPGIGQFRGKVEFVADARRFWDAA